MTNKQIEAMKLALEALEEIALAGMSVAPEMIDGKEAFHARQAWRFIGIAARAMESVKKALAEQPRAQSPDGEGTLAQQDVVTEIISSLEPLLAAKNQSWAQAEKMLLDLLDAAPPAPAPVSEAHKPLTDEQAVKIIQGAIHNLSLTCDGPISAETVGMWVLRAFEAKLKEKNT